MSFPKKTKNPNPSPIEKRFGFSLFGAMEGTRTPGLLIRSQSLYPAELPTHMFRSEHDVFYHCAEVLSTGFLKIFRLFRKRTSFPDFAVDLPAKSRRGQGELPKIPGDFACACCREVPRGGKDTARCGGIPHYCGTNLQQQRFLWFFVYHF